MNAVPKPRKRKCRNPSCKDWFEPQTSLQQACSLHCALVVGQMNREKRERKELRRARERLKTRREWMRDAQTAFNAFIRERDKDLGCISCSWSGEAQFHAGHYRTIAAAPQLRFNEDNCHAQCAQCNNYKSGNIPEYRRALIERIGLERVEALEFDSVIRQYTKEQLKEIRDTYRRKLRELRADET